MTDPYLEYLERPTRERYTQFVVTYTPQIERLVRRLIASEDLASDILQETLLQLGKKRKRPDEIRQPRSYVLGVAFHLVQRHLRSAEARARHEERAGRMRPEICPPSSEHVMAMESILKLHEAIDALPQLSRAVIHLHAIEGLSHQEIAAVIGCSPKAVSMRISRARKQLRSRLGKTQFSLALLKLKDFGPDAWLLERSGRSLSAEARALHTYLLGGNAATSARAELQLGISVALLGVAILGFLLAGKDSRTEAEEGASAVSGEFGRPQATYAISSSTALARRPFVYPRARQAPHEGTILGNDPRQVSSQKPRSEEEARARFLREGGTEMKFRASALTSMTLTLGLSAGLHSANLGDISGDGRISFGDAFLAGRWLDTGLDAYRPSPGSDDFSRFPCQNRLNPGFIIAEALRRVSPTPLPQFLDAWGDGTQGPAPALDPTIRLDLLDVEHGGGSGIELRVKFTSDVPLEFGAFVLTCDGVDLRPAPPPLTSPLISSTEYYLLSRGRLLFHTGLSHPRPIETGRVYALPCVLPRGTPRGAYRLEALDAEVVTAFGEIRRPIATGATLNLLSSPTDGPTQPFPPLAFDPATRTVLGTREIRITDASAPVGGVASVMVQVRSESPLNRIELTARFDPGALEIQEMVPRFKDPDLGAVKSDDHRTLFLNSSVCTEDGGFLAYRYATMPVDTGLFEQSQGQPALKYIAPLGEWVDMVEVKFKVLRGAADLGNVPVQFVDNATSSVPNLVAFFLPYFMTGTGWQSCTEKSSFWDYGTRWVDGAVAVEAAGDPPPRPEPPIAPEQARIQIFIGDSEGNADPPAPRPVSGPRGETVRLPVYFSSAVPLWKVRLSLGYDPTQLDFVAFEADFVDFDGVPFVGRVEPMNEEKKHVQNLVPSIGPDGENQFLVGLIPFSLELYGPPWENVPEDAALLDVATVHCWFYRTGGGLEFWDVNRLVRLGTAEFRIRRDASVAVQEIINRPASWQPYSYVNTGYFLESQTQGYPLLEEEHPVRIFVPALVVRQGIIHITDLATEFLRGDSNLDARVDLSDAVHTLDALFRASATLFCEDAADVNDDGRINISDPIYSLAHSFLGGPVPPAPYPTAGLDPSEDDLGCSPPGR